MKPKQLPLNLSLALISTFLTIGLIEGGARLLGIQPQPSRFSISPLLGWEWTPGYDRVEHYKGVDFRMTISEQGLRNELLPRPKPANSYRILALGDSVVASPGVETADTFVEQLETRLQADYPNQAIELINAGTDDYGAEQELIWLRERGLIYEPDLLILHTYLNDSRSFSRPSPLTARLTNLVNRHSAVYAFYRDNILIALAQRQETQAEFRFRYKEALVQGDWQTDSWALTQLIQAADRDWGLAWYETELLHLQDQILEIAQVARDHDMPFLLVIIPVNVQVYATVDTRLDLTGPQYELVTFAQREGLPVLDLLPILRQHKAADLYFDQVHLKTAGHTLVADALYKALNEYQLLPAP